MSIKEISTLLSEELHRTLYKTLHVRQYPSIDTTEANVTSFVITILEEVLFQIVQDLELKPCSVYLEPEELAELTSEQLSLKITGKADYFIVSSAPKRCKLIFIEVKRDHINSGIKQCVLGAKYAFKKNSNGNQIYCSTTTAESWEDKPTIKLFPGLKLLFTEMKLSDWKTEWITKSQDCLSMIYRTVRKSIATDLGIKDEQIHKYQSLPDEIRREPNESMKSEIGNRMYT